jgi:hypothetical protein
MPPNDASRFVVFNFETAKIPAFIGMRAPVKAPARQQKMTKGMIAILL